MKRALKRKEPGPGGTLVLSFLLHLVIFVIFTQLDLISAISTDKSPVYYVDVVNLPVADPQAGTPSGAGAAVVPEPKPAAPTPPPPGEMQMPSTKRQPAPSTAQPAQPSAPSDSTREFEERLAKLERDAEARHQATALEAARRRAADAGKGPVGMPGATGTEAGSDYASYIRSRLEDAFRMEDTFRPDRNKVVEIRLTIDRTGKIIARRFERSSNDIMFNNAVDRAISRAEREFKPPPGGRAFEHGFVFRPQGVGKN
jgi:colicin import membrane protein